MSVSPAAIPRRLQGTVLGDTLQRGEKLVVIDFFCGAGGMSSGAIRVLESIADEMGCPVNEIAELIAVNHSATAIETHERNHPWVTHLQYDITELRPNDLYELDEVPLEKGDTVHAFIACPDCTHFSSARGGGPKDPDSRATPREILDFVERLNVRNILFENVPEFEDWGPLDDNYEPISEQKGEYFDNWINALTIEGFNVEWQVLNAADYGDATSRRRLFMIGRKDSGVAWPLPTHSEGGEVPGTEPWRTAADIIDWSDLGESVWVRDLRDGRRSPLANNTMKRIAQGIRRHGHSNLAPFADALAEIGPDDVPRLRKQIIPAEYAGIVAETVTDPFLVKYYGTSSTRPVDEPLDTVTSGGQKFALCAPYLLGQHSNATARLTGDRPVPTIAKRGAISMVTPETFVLPKNGKQRDIYSNQAYEPDERGLHTIVSGRADQGYLISPYLVPFYGERSGQRPRVHDFEEPLPTVTASTINQGVTTPYLVEYYGNGKAQPVSAPVPTIPTRDRFALVVPELFPLGIDILFRMLKPSELAAAMGFDPDYDFAGNKGETVAQIGNAVPVNLAASLCEEVLLGTSPTLDDFSDQEVPADD